MPCTLRTLLLEHHPHEMRDWLLRQAKACHDIGSAFRALDSTGDQLKAAELAGKSEAYFAVAEHLEHMTRGAPPFSG